MNNEGWEYLFKINPYDFTLCSTNVLYVPTLNEDKTVMCMHFDEDAEEYMQGSCVPRTLDLEEQWFRRELKYLTIFQGQPWCPNILHVDERNRKIYIEYHKETINHICFDENRNLNDEYPDWKEQLFDVIKSIMDQGYYKCSLYPHCFYFDEHKVLKTIDFYATIEKDNHMMHKDIITPIIGVDSHHRYIEAQRGDYYDFEYFYKRTIQQHLTWPEDVMHGFYKDLFVE